MLLRCPVLSEGEASTEWRNVRYWHLAVDIGLCAANVPNSLHMSAFDPKRRSECLFFCGQNLAVSPNIGPCIVMSNS